MYKHTDSLSRCLQQCFPHLSLFVPSKPVHYGPFRFSHDPCSFFARLDFTRRKPTTVWPVPINLQRNDYSNFNSIACTEYATTAVLFKLFAVLSLNRCRYPPNDCISTVSPSFRTISLLSLLIASVFCMSQMSLEYKPCLGWFPSKFSNFSHCSHRIKLSSPRQQCLLTGQLHNISLIYYPGHRYLSLFYAYFISFKLYSQYFVPRSFNSLQTTSPSL